MSERRHLRLIVGYDGTAYSGWQRQANGPSVQAAIEDALAAMCGEPTILRGAGRTDAGVHARAQVASFFTTTKIPPLGFLRGLNTKLARDISIMACDEVPLAFDARRWARGKHYRYQIWNQEARSALHDRFVWHLHHALDVEAMRAAAPLLLGRHDFSGYRAADCDRQNPVRELRRLDISADGPLVVFDVEGTAFLKHMVRILVGTLADVGLGRRPPAHVRVVLESRDRKLGGRTAPAKGLTLWQVFQGDGPSYALAPDAASQSGAEGEDE